MTLDKPAPTGDAGFLRVRVLQKRPQFLAAARGAKAVTPSMIVQARPRGDDSDHVGVGFTCSKKVGNAVARNRAKRRLRAAARAVLPVQARAGVDYVLIGRAEKTAARPFAALKGDLLTALGQLHPSEERP